MCTPQVLHGLDYLHADCGLIHTDLKPENVMLRHALRPRRAHAAASAAAAVAMQMATRFNSAATLPGPAEASTGAAAPAAASPAQPSPAAVPQASKINNKHSRRRKSYKRLVAMVFSIFPRNVRNTVWLLRRVTNTSMLRNDKCPAACRIVRPADDCRPHADRPTSCWNGRHQQHRQHRLRRRLPTAS